MNRWLIDAGAFVAYLDPKDLHHVLVSASLEQSRPAFWTTMPIITEAMHLLARVPDGPAELLEFIQEAQVAVEPCSTFQDMHRIVVLMEKYHDIPMDFADGSLVCLADDLNIRDILTTDERGFRVFRIHGRQSFHLVLDDFPG